MNILKPYGALGALLCRLVDAALISLALLLAGLALDHEWTTLTTIAAVAAAAIFVFAGELYGLYRSWRLSSLDDEFAAVIMIWGGTCCALVMSAFLAKVSGSFSRLELIVWFLMTPAMLIVARLAVRALLRGLRVSGRNTRTVAVAGAGPLASSIIGHLEEPGTFGMRLIGVFDDRSPARIVSDGHDASRCVGHLSDLLERARLGGIDYVFIALPMRAEGRIIELANRLADTTVSVYVVPDLFVFDLMRARFVTVGGLPAVSVYESPFDGVSGALKRAEDLILGTLFLTAAFIPMGLIALGIKLTTNGTVLFKQKRYGLNGRVLDVWKFRTMDASDDGAHVPQVTRTDPRVTSFGRILRTTSLDELPQLFNVLKGDMSLVGPRPHAVAHNEEYRRLVHGYMLRHKVKPGITGWAQVNGWRGELNVAMMQKRVEHDLEYVQNWSLFLDIKILFLTVVAVFSRKNAY